MPTRGTRRYPRRAMKNSTRTNRIMTATAIGALLITCGQSLAQTTGPATPSVEGTSPLFGYFIAIALSVLLVVVSIIPSKRHVEDL